MNWPKPVTSNPFEDCRSSRRHSKLFMLPSDAIISKAEIGFVLLSDGSMSIEIECFTVEPRNPKLPPDTHKAIVVIKRPNIIERWKGTTFEGKIRHKAQEFQERADREIYDHNIQVVEARGIIKRLTQNKVFREPRPQSSITTPSPSVKR